jgi:outer membrane protein TolC
MDPVRAAACDFVCAADRSRTIPVRMGGSRRIPRTRLLCLATLISILGPVSDEVRGQSIPPSPNRPWSPPDLESYEKELANLRSGDLEAATIDPDKVYDLPALIDIAERTNPETRVAWERARQAASAVGLSESAYFPYLAASASAGYANLFIPFPVLQQGPGPREVSIVGGSALGFDLKSASVTLDMKWLLFDFGERKASKTVAEEGLTAADVGFNAVHQQIVFAVAQRYYEFNAARQKVEAAESSQSAAKTVAESVRARLDHGLATRPELLQAEQEAARAAFDLEVARGAMSDALVALVGSLGILPTTKLQVSTLPERSFDPDATESLEDLIGRALVQRPDLVAKLSKVRASRAAVQGARAAYYPKFVLEANVGWLGLSMKTAGTPFFGAGQTVYGGAILASVPVFDGFARREKLQIAESELQASEEELAHSRDSVIQEVWKVRTQVESALRKLDSAEKLIAASESAYTASLEAYHHGLGTYVEVANAQRYVAAARSAMVDTRAAVYISITNLALTVGDLAKPAPNQGGH